MNKLSPLALALAAAFAVAGAQAQSTQTDRAAAQADQGTTASDRARGGRDELKDAQQEIDEAVQVVQRMKSDPHMQTLLRDARGVFILTKYGRAGLGVGVQGGEGVLVTRKREDFSNPVFYNLGGLSFGLQAGAAGGEVAMLLMTDRAVQQFQSGKKFSLNADLGLTIANYSRRSQASAGKIQDVVVWSNTKGAYAGATVAITDVMVDREANRAYYGRDVADPLQIMEGRVNNPRNNVLGMVLGA
jgi:lipid-binding SYLF domain-containing protein